MSSHFLSLREKWSWRSDLNRRPAVYETAALPLSYTSANILVNTLYRFYLEECQYQLINFSEDKPEEF